MFKESGEPGEMEMIPEGHKRDYSACSKQKMKGVAGGVRGRKSKGHVVHSPNRELKKETRPDKEDWVGPGKQLHTFEGEATNVGKLKGEASKSQGKSVTNSGWLEEMGKRRPTFCENHSQARLRMIERVRQERVPPPTTAKAPCYGERLVNDGQTLLNGRWSVERMPSANSPDGGRFEGAT